VGLEPHSLLIENRDDSGCLLNFKVLLWLGSHLNLEGSLCLNGNVDFWIVKEVKK